MPFDLQTFEYSSLDSDILNQATIGHQYYTVPANSYCDVSVLLIGVPDQPGNLVVSGGFSNLGGMGQIGIWRYVSGPADNSVITLEGVSPDTAGVPTPEGTTRTFKAKFDTALCLLFVPDALDPSFFQGVLVLRIYS